MEQTPDFSSIRKAINDISQGKLVIVMDDETRENEGDLVMGAQFATPDLITFMINNTTGILCVPMTERRAFELGLPLMVTNNQDPKKTAYTVSCDHKTCTTGVSSEDRAKTISSLGNYGCNKDEFVRPGHVFPLIAEPGGLFVRRGHTEASVELCNLANIGKIAVIAELKNEDGTMMRYDNCKEFAKKYGLTLITIDNLKKYLDVHKYCRIIANCDLPLNNYGMWKLYSYFNEKCETSHHKVIIKGNIYDKECVTVRIHSECFTGDVLGSLMCDCGKQLKKALKLISQKGRGIIILPGNHEGRGIGITNKIKAYKLMQSNHKIDTYEANKLLGLPEDSRDYSDVVKILDDLGIDKIELLTNNPDKIKSLQSKIVKVTPLKSKPNEYNKKYLNTKLEKHNKMNELHNFNKIAILPIDHKKKDIKVAIILTQWNNDLIMELYRQIFDELVQLNINGDSIKKIVVPGSFEIPLGVKRVINSNKFDVIICLGIIIKGETAHFENVSQAVTNALMILQLKKNIPIIDSVISCYDIKQAESRFSKGSGLAKSLALTALNMCNLDDVIREL